MRCITTSWSIFSVIKYLLFQHKQLLNEINKMEIEQRASLK